jgi:hypothetical protein
MGSDLKRGKIPGGVAAIIILGFAIFGLLRLWIAWSGPAWLPYLQFGFAAFLGILLTLCILKRS